MRPVQDSIFSNSNCLSDDPVMLKERSLVRRPQCRTLSNALKVSIFISRTYRYGQQEAEGHHYQLLCNCETLILPRRQTNLVPLKEEEINKKNRCTAQKVSIIRLDQHRTSSRSLDLSVVWLVHLKGISKPDENACLQKTII